MAPLKFVLVTPSYNLSEFIEETIYSVVGQAGNFSICYHVQDGGSTDGTVAILEKWDELLTTKEFPKFCENVSFTYSVAPDVGMYDAINRGFNFAMQDQQPCLMNWINADDLLLPGALAAVASFFENNPSDQLVGGRIAVICDKGFANQFSKAEGKPRADIARGYYDGERYDFINQVCTFWRSELWHRAGGLNSSLKYAGDFDLWRRFARDADYRTLDTFVGAHRMREGQLSSNMVAYSAEVDAVSNENEVFEDIERADEQVYKYDAALEAWRKGTGPRQPTGWEPISGIGLPEGPYSELEIESGCWVTGKTAEIAVHSEFSGDCMLQIEFRNPFFMQNITIRGTSWKIDKAPMKTKLHICAPIKSDKGLNYFTLGIGSLAPERGTDRTLGIFIDDIKIVRNTKWYSRAARLVLSQDRHKFRK